MKRMHLFSNTQRSWAALLLLIAARVPLSSAVLAAGFERYQSQAVELFGRYDRNRDELIDSTEAANLPLEARVWLEQNGFDWEAGAPRDDFIAVAPFLLHSVETGAWDAVEAKRSAEQSRQTSEQAGAVGIGSVEQTATSPSDRAAGTSWEFTRDLPSDFASMDRDGDEQVGLYEWPVGDVQRFLRTDRNGDGFITPREAERSGSQPQR